MEGQSERAGSWAAGLLRLGALTLLGAGFVTTAHRGWSGTFAGVHVYAAKLGTRDAPAAAGDEPHSGQRPAEAYGLFVLVGADRVVLINSGIDDASQARRWRIDIRRSAGVLRDLGITPEDVTDVVLTHAHWDHLGELSAWPRARFWIQDAELFWAEDVARADESERSGVRREQLDALRALDAAGRLVRVSGDARLAPGILLHAAHGHTASPQWVEVRGAGSGASLALTCDPSWVGGAQEGMRVVALHDRGVWERYPEVAPDIAVVD